MKCMTEKTIVLGALLAVLACAGGRASAAEYPGESKYDTTVYSDEALVNLRIRNHRWPDCYSMETAVADMFRLEGVGDTTGDATEAKAFAMWRWLNTLTANNGGRYFEGNPFGKRVRCVGDMTRDQIEIRRGDKVLMVYGTHECGGLGRVMAHLWRAAGYLAYQEASRGHSTSVLRYPDADGVWRMHSFDPLKRACFWNTRAKCVGMRYRPPGMRGLEWKTFLPPMQHTLRMSLRPGEVVRRKWENDGYIQKTKLMLRWIGERGENRRTLKKVSVVGQEDQVLVAGTDPQTFRGPLWKDSQNVACSPPADGRAILHPEKAGTTAAFIYRLASPYIAIESTIEATLRKTADGDVCRMAFSTDSGKTWHTIYDKKTLGVETVKVTVGRDIYWKPQPSITSYYSFLVKAEFKTDGKPAQVGADVLKVTVHRQLNMRVLPNLMPAENVFKISADAIRPGLALKLSIDYEVNGKPVSVTRVVGKFPHYFRIDVNGLPESKLDTPYYLANWGEPRRFNSPSHPLRMTAISMRLVPLASVKPDASMPVKAAEAFFGKAYPTVKKFDRRMIREERFHKHESEVSGFFPQLPREPGQPTDPREYYNWLIDHMGDAAGPSVPKCPEGTDPIEMLIKKLPKAHGVHVLGICNVVAHMKDKRAIPALLAKWEQAPNAGPGDRHIPDALAAIGDRSVVPALCRRVKQLRFDHRVHVAWALGILGGEEAVKMLRDLAANDPNISARGEAARALVRAGVRGQGSGVRK